MIIDPPAQLAAAGLDSEPDLDGQLAAGLIALTEAPDGQVLVTLPPEIDIINDNEVRGMLDDALTARPAMVIADGSRTTFCGASGVSILVQAHHRAAAAGAQLRVVATALEVRRILQITGACSELRVYPTIEAALQTPATS